MPGCWNTRTVAFVDPKTMEENDDRSEKRNAVDYLSFGAKTAKRVAWEAWEFTVEGPHQVRVTNASYGYLKDDHSYVVGVEVRDGQALPAECGCPADRYSEEYACKHRVSLATIGGPTVLNAAVEYEAPAQTGDSEPTTAADKLRADGGDVLADSDATDDEPCEDCLGDFPCFDCFEPDGDSREEE